MGKEENGDGVALEKRGRFNDEAVWFDELHRDPYLLGLVDVICQSDPPLVIGVHGDWGSGKTSFMRTLQCLLDEKMRTKYGAEEGEAGEKGLAARAEEIMKKGLSGKGHLPVVWFNPWAHQFEDEPVLPLLDAVRHQQKGAWGRVNEKFRKIVEDPKFRIIGKAALGVARMAGPGWFTALAQQIGDEAREVMDRFNNFREEFTKCVAELTKYEGKLVIFVDDLDRCEAEYVVKILESLKLHFLTPQCVFVVGCAEQRVKKCLVGKVGIESDAEAKEYLEKIIQLPVRLPRMMEQHLDGLLRRLGWGKFTRESNADCFQLLKAFAGNNPRRLKRFLHWYRMERSMVEAHEKVLEKAKDFFADESVFLKVKMLQFMEPDEFVDPEDFVRAAIGEKGAPS